MLNVQTENLLARVVAFGTCFTTIFVVSSSVTDPVNVTKLLSLGVTASVAVGLLVFAGFKNIIKTNLVLIVTILGFLFSGLVSIISSESPLSQGFYGAYGRNNGLLAYIFLALLIVCCAILVQQGSIRKIIQALFIAGIINVIYCLWVIVFGDFVGWNNPYGNILGTFGNPNFIGSFLGIFLGAYLGYGLSKESSRYFKISMFFVLPVTAYEIYDSSAIQGRIVGLLGVGIVGFFFLRSKYNPLIQWVYSSVVTVIGFFAVLGALQIGPLTSFIYKNSVSLRGQYWLAGWNTGERFPFTGVGMDSFGDWYRRSRDIHALELPGVNTVVNAAHNVPLDMFAFGGWPLMTTYVLIMSMGGIALFRATIRAKKYDPILVVLVTAWTGYQAQSLISINQIGLAIWGWVLTGTAIAYERMSRSDANPNFATIKNSKITSRKSKSQESEILKGTLSAASFGLVGLLLSLPPITSDSQWRKAQVAGTVQAIEESMDQKYFNPQNTMKYMINIQDLEKSNLPELAHKYALQAVRWNSESYDLWKLLYFVRNSTAEEKSEALRNMKRLDPLNPDVTAS